jgi:lipoprotein-anchoring transpeptidase ErfK/SrfK
VVDYRTNEVPGTIVIDTPNTYLYFVLPRPRAATASASAARASPVGRQNVTKKASGRIRRRRPK